ncbi:MAG TPA: TIGR03435 family protein [Bryobacteraceae bacterium]|nr:TIGR03435 family protein [Bryobacteraceae bacterium]
MRFVLLLTLAATLLHAQSFEVASVKVNTSGTGMSSFPGLRNGHLKSSNATMRQILQVAWGLSSVQITGPSWLDSDRYDLDAKAPDGVPDTELKPMLQALLKERFNLQAHPETKELPVYDLVVLKGGPKIQPADPGRPFTQPARLPGACCMMVNVKGTMDQLATALAGPAGRPVIDKTGLDGAYVYVLQYAQLGTAVDPDSAPDIFGAVQQQLGLKLESDKAPVPVLVVESANRVPSGN